MKTRVISAIVLILICFPPLFLGGNYLKALLALVALLSAYEFTSIRKKRFNILLYLMMILFVLAINLFNNYATGISLFLLIALFVSGILFEDISLDDISATFMMANIIAFAITSIIKIYDKHSLYLFFYILIASFACDIGALFTGMAFGKHKLCPRISPKKTVEGAIGGWLSGFILSFIFAYIFNYFDLGITYCLFYSLTLPLVAQIGDLSFSLIKRNYEVKDFGSIIPGHGGVLDRIDSVLFCLIFLASTGVFFGL